MDSGWCLCACPGVHDEADAILGLAREGVLDAFNDRSFTSAILANNQSHRSIKLDFAASRWIEAAYACDSE